MGGEELGVVFLLALLLFGPSQLPKLAKGLGEAMREFKKNQRESEEPEDEPKDAEKDRKPGP